MKILVTGSAGFIGYHLSKRLLEAGNQVVGIDSINDYYDVRLKYARLETAGIHRNLVAKGQPVQSDRYPAYRFIQMHLEDRQALQNLFGTEKFDAVVNLAAQAGVRYSIENPYAYIDSNIVGFLNLLECVRHNPVRHFVYASSSSVYGGNTKTPFSEEDRVDNPVSLYAATKKSNELMAHVYSGLYGIPTTGLRFFTVYGPHAIRRSHPGGATDQSIQSRQSFTRLHLYRRHHRRDGPRHRQSPGPDTRPSYSGRSL